MEVERGDFILVGGTLCRKLRYIETEMGTFVFKAIFDILQNSRT